jgi:hypothetical protein
MGCDMLVARGPATVSGHTLFGLNLFDTVRRRLRLRQLPASYHSPDEVIYTPHLELPQVRQTCSVLGVQTDNAWGFEFGCNEHRVAIGVARWCSRFDAQPGLTGSELTRLALERSHSAFQAVEVLTDLIARHGQCDPDTTAPSAVFLIADGQEACVLEVAGSCWALLECPEARAVSDVGLIRQDWQRLAPGLAEQAIQHGWWHDDGTKLDFVGSLGQSDPAHAWSLKRWSRATLALAQQQGALDALMLRRLLTDHFETCVRRHPLAPKKMRRLGSVVARLDGSEAPLIWFAAGSTSTPLYFPLPVGAELPEVWSTQPPDEDGIREGADRLQGQFDQDAEDFVAESAQLTSHGEGAARRRLAHAMMQKHLEQCELEIRRRDVPKVVAVGGAARDDELVPFFG